MATPPLLLRLSLTVVRTASWLAPRAHREKLRSTWEAELHYQWSQEVPGPWASFFWSFGAFRHAWHRLRSVYTIDSVWQDVRFGSRSLNRNRGLIGVGVLSLAVGIAANTTIFSMVDVFMFKPLPYPEPERLLMVWTTNRERGIERSRMSIPDFVDLKEQVRTVDIAGFMEETFNLSGDFEAERLRGYYVTSEFFRVLGVSPALGRGFTEEDALPGHEKVAVISHELWQRRFGSDAELLGSSVLLDGGTHTVIGISTPGFWVGSPGIDVWVPGAPTGDEPRDFHVLRVLGRVRQELRQEQVTEEVARIMASLAAAHPETSAGNGGSVESLHDAVFNRGFREGSAIAMAAVALVLLIACSNVTNLLLTHAAGRGPEVALREALGASRSRIARQVLTEAFLVAGLGGLLGLGISFFGIQALVQVLPAEIPRVDEMTLSPRVLVFSTVLTLAAALLFGMPPAVRSGKANLGRSLKGAGGGRIVVRNGRLRKGLVVAEVAMAMVLLVSSALLLQGFHRLRLGEMGFDRSDVLAMRTQLSRFQFPDTASVNEFYLELEVLLESLPGVEAVGGIDILPGSGTASGGYALSEGSLDDGTLRGVSAFRFLLPGYFDAMDIPLLRGRGFDKTDRRGAPPVAVISESLAQRHWPTGDPIGRHITTSAGTREIVGVVADIRNPGMIDEPPATIYFSALQGSEPFMGWTIEASVPPSTLVDPVRSAIRSVDPTIPAYDVMSLDALIDEGIGGDLILAKVMGTLALLAIILALGGVYGVTAHGVSQRTHELGVRMSLGARRGNILGTVVRQGVVLALIGIALGACAASALTPGLSRFLFSVNPSDPLTFFAISLSLLAVSVAATVFPARKATRVDPASALKAE